MSINLDTLKLIVKLTHKDLFNEEVRASFYKTFSQELKDKNKIFVVSKIYSKFKDPNLNTNKNDLELISLFSEIVKRKELIKKINYFLVFTLFFLCISLIFNIGVSFFISLLVTVIFSPVVKYINLQFENLLFKVASMIKRKNYFDHSHRLRIWSEHDLIYFHYLDNESFYPLIGLNINLIFTLNKNGDFINQQNNVKYLSETEHASIGEILVNLITYDRIKIV